MKLVVSRPGKKMYQDGEKFIKVFDPDYSKADILNEALNQARIEETGLKIPKIKSVTTVDGKWAIVSEYIKGKTLSQLIKENPEKFDARVFITPAMDAVTKLVEYKIENVFKCANKAKDF